MSTEQRRAEADIAIISAVLKPIYKEITDDEGNWDMDHFLTRLDEVITALQATRYALQQIQSLTR